MFERTSLGSVRAEPDPRAKLRLYGEFSPRSLPDTSPFNTSSETPRPSDPDARTVWADLQDERRKGVTMFARARHNDGHPRPRISINHARDVLWTYNSAELFQLLVLERGWSPKRYGQWVAAALVAATSGLGEKTAGRLAG